MVDVLCVIVDGMIKNFVYKFGEFFNKKVIKVQWNVVYVKDEWCLIDVYWVIICVEINSGDILGEIYMVKYIKRRVERKVKLEYRELVDECYFFIEFFYLVWIYLFDDEKWQLLFYLMKQLEFEKFVYV